MSRISHVAGIVVFVTLTIGALWPGPVALGQEPAAGPEGGDKVSVVLVTEGNLFLEKAVAAQPGVTLRVIAPTRYHAASAPAADVTILDRHEPAELPKGGGLMFIDCLPKGGALKGAVDAKGDAVKFAEVRAK